MRRAEALALLDDLDRTEPFPGAARIGLTGAPGAGKSTLIDAMVRTLRARGDSVAIAAVDPSSHKSGGALLGDRIRMRAGSTDAGVFIRSMAARDRLGGLAEATYAAVSIMGAVFDYVFVETVGIGQSEGDVAGLVDTLVFVANPGAGDTLQFMKAGILERPDIFVVNKSDIGALAERAASELSSGLGLAEREQGKRERPVLLTSARDAVGVAELVDALDSHRAAFASSGELEKHRHNGREAYVLAALERRYGSFGVEQLGGAKAVRERLSRSPARSPFGQVAHLGREIELALGK